MPENRSYESAVDYVIKSVKLLKAGETIEIRNVVGQLDIFENIELPYLTAQIVFKDDTKIFDTIGFDGVEVCEIILSQPKTSPTDIQKTFVVKSVNDTVKINDNSEVVSLYLIEKIGYDGSLERFSKSYTGTPLTIVNKIAREKLSIAIDQPSVAPAQKEMKVVIPYLTPLEAISFVMERMTTEDGLPYHFYSSLTNDNLQIKSLEELLKRESWNTNKPYRYSQAYTQGETDHNAKTNPYIVEKYYAPTSGEDTLSLIVDGAIGGNFSVVDFTTGRNETKHFEITETLSKLETKGVIPKGLTQVVETNYAGNKLQNLRSVDVHRSIMLNTYETSNNYYQEDTIDAYELDMIRKAIKKILFKSPINLKIPGVPFLVGSNNSIGSNIDYFHMNNNLQSSESRNANQETLKDKKRSGKYMIFTTHHTFYERKHTVEISAVKIGKEATL